jgi:toxin ParE1/3/4
MSTMNISLPESLKSFVDEQVSERGYGTSVPRELASADVDRAVAHYLDEGGEPVALKFIDSLAQAYAHISTHPAAGSPRYAHELNLPGLLSGPLTRYPYSVFYVEQPERIDIWRVLHQHRDIPAWMHLPSGV